MRICVWGVCVLYVSCFLNASCSNSIGWDDPPSETRFKHPPHNTIHIYTMYLGATAQRHRAGLNLIARSTCSTSECLFVYNFTALPSWVFVFTQCVSFICLLCFYFTAFEYYTTHNVLHIIIWPSDGGLYDEDLYYIMSCIKLKANVFLDWYKFNVYIIIYLYR